MLTQLLTRSAENPSISPTDPDAGKRLFGGATSDSGIRVTVQSSLTYSPLYSGVTMLADDVAMIPRFVFRKRVNGGKDRDTSHPSYRVVRHKANPIHTAFTWAHITIAHAVLWGNAYSLINRDRGARVVELLPLNPDSTHPVMKAGNLVYETRIDNKRRTFSPENIFHIRGLSIDGLAGENLINLARNSLGRGIAASKYAGKFFSNDTRPSGVISHPHKLKDTALKNLRDSIEALHGGVENSHRVAILEEAMTWTPIGTDPEKAQMIETLAFSVKDVARWLKMPPHRLGDETRTSFNSVEQENLAYQQSTLGPWFAKLRDESFDKLLTEREKQNETHTIEEQRIALLAADAPTRCGVYATALQNGILNRDEVRNFENLNPIPDGEGQQFFLPLNMTMTGDEEVNQDDEQMAESSDDRSRSALTELIEDCARRACNRLCHYSQRASKKNQSIVHSLQSQEKTIGEMFNAAASVLCVSGVASVTTGADLGSALIRHWVESVEKVDGHDAWMSRSQKLTELLPGKLSTMLWEAKGVTHDGSNIPASTN